jgi:glycosyltransferase involved in cell wall biosynthesis
MRIVQASKAYFPHLGGVETVVQQLAEGFATRYGFDSRVVVCSDTGKGSREEIRGVQVRRAATLGRAFSLPLSPAYPLALMRETGDVLHIHEPSLLPAAAYMSLLPVARRRFKRLVVWWHSDIVRQKTFALAYRPLLHGLLRRADAIITATPKHISSSAFLPAYQQKCHVIHYGIDPDRFTSVSKKEHGVSHLAVDDQRPLVLFVGRLVYYKGVEYLVRAMNQVPAARLLVVGNGPLEDSLKQMAAQGVGNISFVPFLSQDDMTAVMQACDIFVLPSVENSEAFGIVQLEAMACGKPVITADLPTGVTYVNQADVTGLVVPARDPARLAEAIHRLVRDSALRQRLGDAARARALRDFTVDKMVDLTVALYRELLG